MDGPRPGEGGAIIDPPDPDLIPPTDEEERKRLLAAGFSPPEIDRLFAQREADRATLHG